LKPIEITAPPHRHEVCKTGERNHNEKGCLAHPGIERKPQ
jgi:hypothetical protein